jgi:hypothetical protein
MVLLNIFSKLILHGNIEKNFNVMNIILNNYSLNPNHFGLEHGNQKVLILKMLINVNGVIIKKSAHGVKKNPMNLHEKNNV